VTDSPTVPPGSRTLNDLERAALAEEMAKVVASSHLFKSLDEIGRERVLESGYVCSFAPENTVITEGEAGEVMFLILDGKVKVATQAPGGTLQLAELGRGACIGEVAVLTGTPRTATVTALTEVSCVAFPRKRILRILSDYPKVRQVLEALVEGRARDTIEKLMSS